MNSETGEGFSKCDGGLGFPYRGSRGERGEEDAWKKNKGNSKAKGERRKAKGKGKIKN